MNIEQCGKYLNNDLYCIIWNNTLMYVAVVYAKGQTRKSWDTDFQIVTGAGYALAQTDYNERRSQVASAFIIKLALKYARINTHNYASYYKYTPQTILENTTHKRVQKLLP